MAQLVLYTLLIVSMIYEACVGAKYEIKSHSQMLVVPECNMQDCFIKGWCEKTICGPNNKKTCTNGCEGSKTYNYGGDPNWAANPVSVKDSSGVIWYNCHCPCCDRCQGESLPPEPDYSGMSFFMKQLLMRRRSLMKK